MVAIAVAGAWYYLSTRSKPVWMARTLLTATLVWVGVDIYTALVPYFSEV